MIEPGTPAPDFRLTDDRGEEFTRADLLAGGKRCVLVFFPNAFAPVCSDQLALYWDLRERFAELGAEIVGVSCDQSWSLRAFKKQIGVDFKLLSDFEPKGEASRAFGAWFEPAGFSDRALVLVEPDGTVSWSHRAENPGVLPGANLIFDALER